MDATLERLGTAGILVIALVIAVRYFIGVVASKDKAITDLTERFIGVTERFATVTETNTHTLENMQGSLDRLTGEFRSALGDAIVQGAHEAMKGAVQVAQQARIGGLPGRSRP